jgi:hypothetical protein
LGRTALDDVGGSGVEAADLRYDANRFLRRVLGDRRTVRHILLLAIAARANATGSQ